MIASRYRRFRQIGVVLCGVAVLTLLAFMWAWQKFQQALPPLNGEFLSAGLNESVTLQRDDIGALVVLAGGELDAYQGLGFAHAQDRFFQMDLARRRAAGELSALVGAGALPLDRQAVIHRFRAQVTAHLTRMPVHELAALEAYARGVNAGLASLPDRPWEYLLLRTHPVPWRPEDSLLAGLALAFTLQDSSGRREWDLAILRDQLGGRAVDFFAPLLTPTDAALDGTNAPLGPPPTARAVNLRQDLNRPVALTGLVGEAHLHPGSNFLGVPGALSETGAALIAGDPHLDLLVPNTWYRATLQWPDAGGGSHRVTGLSLPGVPGIVIGSNGHLAWTFTNSGVDSGDLIQVELHPAAPDLYYVAPEGPVEFERRTDTIVVRGDADEVVESTWTQWGPIVAQPPGGRPFAHRWVMAEPGAITMGLLGLATATTLEQALPIVHLAGMPAQNALLASRDGQLAWTIAGRLPHRQGFDGRFPTSWAFGDRHWDGLLAPERVPVIRAHATQVLWSGNQRKVGGDALAVLGDGGYESPPRAARLAHLLHTRVARSTPLAPADLLAMQLDVGAPWMEPWRELLLATLDEAALDGQRRRQEFRAALADETLAAEIEAVSYRLLRAWITALSDRTLTPLFERNTRVAADWSSRRFDVLPAVAHLHREEGNLHLLAPAYASWRELRLAAVDDVIAELRRAKTSPVEATWGEVNRARIHHPLADALPRPIRAWFNLPPDALPGDSDLPRVQRPKFGASARLVVSPGHEEEAILHLPGGQSGHPLSPYYRAGHRDWVEGNPTPLLPSTIRHSITLRP
jgi:penicillin amidase